MATPCRTTSELSLILNRGIFGFSLYLEVLGQNRIIYLIFERLLKTRFIDQSESIQLYNVPVLNLYWP